MRAFAKSKWAIVLLALLALALGVGVGISNPFTGVTGGGFVQAGQHSFGTRDANRYLNQYIENVDRETGEAVTARQAAEQGVTNQIVQVLQQRAATLAFADQLGVKASSSAVAKIFAEAPRFRDALGIIQLSEIENFAYNEAFRDRTEFEAFQRDEVTIGYLEQAALAGLQTPSILVDPLVEWVGERRLISYAILAEDSVAEIAEPSEEELRAFYDERQNMFRQPERRAISGILYSPDDFVDPTPITDEMVEDAYNTRIRSFTTGESREIAEITGPDSATVQEVVDLVKQGTDVETAVSQVAEASFTTREVEPETISDADYSGLIFSLPEGDIAGPFVINDMPLAVVVRSVSGGVVQPLEEVAESLRMELAQQDARRAFNSSAEAFYDLVGAGVSLDEISEELNLPTFTLLPIDQRGGSEAHGAMMLLNVAPDAITEIFSLQVGEFSDVVEAEDLRGVLRLNEIVDSHTLTFEEVREELLPIYQSVKASEQANEVLEAAVERVNAGEDIDTVARELDFTVVHPEQFATRPMDPNRPNPLLSTAFAIGVGEAAVVAAPQGPPMFVRVREVLPIDEAQRPAALEQVETLLNESLSRDVQQTYNFAAGNSVNIKTNLNAVTQYLNSYLTDEQ